MRPEMTFHPDEMTVREFSEHIVRSQKSECVMYGLKIDSVNWEAGSAEELFESLCRITQKGFCQNPSTLLWQDIRNHLKSSDHLYVVAEGPKVASYALFDFLPQYSTLYLSGAIVDPEYQGMRISSTLISEIVKRFQPKYLTARTQNPVMYQSIQRACSGIYPNKDGFVPNDIRELGLHIAKEKLGMSDYHQASMMEVGTYGGCLYGTEPKSHDDEFDLWFRSKIDLQRGDAMIIVGVV